MYLDDRGNEFIAFHPLPGQIERTEGNPSALSTVEPGRSGCSHPPLPARCHPHQPLLSCAQLPLLLPIQEKKGSVLRLCNNRRSGAIIFSLMNPLQIKSHSAIFQRTRWLRCPMTPAKKALWRRPADRRILRNADLLRWLRVQPERRLERYGRRAAGAGYAGTRGESRCSQQRGQTAGGAPGALANPAGQDPLKFGTAQGAAVRAACRAEMAAVLLRRRDARGDA